MARRWLGQVDAMRPIKQVGVVSTHSILYFAPAAATVGSGAALLLLHVSREGFFFISACMLTYAYADLLVFDLAGLGRFYRRRCVSVLIPYVCWNVIYFLYLLPTAHYASAGSALGHLAFLLAIGYYQLYFLLVIMQFYLVFPLVLVLLRRTRGHHGLVLAMAAAAQVAIAIATHWSLFPALMVRYAQQDALSYLLYLIGGAVVAFHLDEVHAWVCGHARLILMLTLVAGLVAEGIYFLAQDGVTSVLGSGSDPFQPSVIAFNIGAITCGYLAGVALVKPGAFGPDQDGGADGFGRRVRHLPVPDGVHHRADVAGLGKAELGGAVAGAVLGDRGHRLGLRHRADQPAGPDAAGRAADRAQAGAACATPAGRGACRAGAVRADYRARRTGGRGGREERIVTVISEWIDAAPDDAVYLEEASGPGTLTYGGLRRAVSGMALRLDRAGVPGRGPSGRPAAGSARVRDQLGQRPGRGPGRGPA